MDGRQDGDIGDLPSEDKKIEEEAEKNRKKLDEPPPSGTDPLHEGP